MTTSEDSSFKEGLRGRVALRSFGEKREEIIIVCERLARFGAARGPPGTEGVVTMLTGRGAEFVGGFLTRSLPDNEEEGELSPLLLFLSFLTLAFRLSDEKNPGLLTVGETSDRVED
jgi:hypothetical protein